MLKAPRSLTKPRPDFWFFVKLALFAWMAIFMIYPFYTLVTRSFFSTKAEGFTLYNFIRFFSKPYYYTTLKNTAVVCVLATLTTVIVGVPLAYLMTRYNIFGKKLFYIFIIMALMSPPFIGAYSWILLFGRAGFVTKLFAQIGVNLPTIYGLPGIVLVFTFHLFPYVYLYVSGAMTNIDSSLEEAGENLGSGKFRRLMTITLPVVAPSIAAGAVMVFMAALADFGTPMLIGEGYTVLSVLVYNEYMSEMGGNANMASALAVIIVVCALIVLMFQKFWIARKNYVMTAMRPPQEVKLRGWKRFLVTLPVAIVSFIGLLPQIVVVVCSFIKADFTGFKGGFSLESYQTIWSRLSTNITNTYVYSGIAIVFIVLFGMLLSYIIVRKRGASGQFFDTMIMFPYVIPGSVLGISLIVAFNRPPLILTGTAVIMILSFVIRKLPYTVRSGTAFLYQMDPSIEEASVNLGVSPMKTFFRITAVLMLPGILSGAVLSWITCINELSSSVMLYGGRTSTIAVAIYQEVIRMSDGTAAALATILSATTVVSLLIFLRFSKGRVSIV